MANVLTEVITLRVPHSMYKLINRLAAEERRPIGMMARVLVEEAINNRKNGKKK